MKKKFLERLMESYWQEESVDTNVTLSRKECSGLCHDKVSNSKRKTHTRATEWSSSDRVFPITLIYEAKPISSFKVVYAYFLSKLPRHSSSFMHIDSPIFPTRWAFVYLSVGCSIMLVKGTLQYFHSFPWPSRKEETLTSIMLNFAVFE